MGKKKLEKIARETTTTSQIDTNYNPRVQDDAYSTNNLDDIYHIGY